MTARLDPPSPGSDLPGQVEAETTQPPGAEASPEAAAKEELLDLALADLRFKRAELEAEIEELESRRAVLQQDLGASFAGQSDAIARRLKGFRTTWWGRSRSW